uniref:NADH dehydrogenase subunit 5 n=1 Tax=Sternochetus olivieri TaxID=2302647 RepID=UPI0022377501|nr:NADH dehydrogenase subunit 5 [Sternochetus olivieri]UYP50720.1 NADH dehydrogenase subunit 5 [Sternochetus olivieri]
MSICILYYKMFMFYSLCLYFLSLYLLNMDFTFYMELNILTLNSVSIEMVVYFDWMSLMFMSFVFFISSLIMNYSEEYMMGDKNLKRFIYLMVMFVFSMMLVIMSPNLISILLGWDGLGLVSYILVIYYQNVKSYNAGMLTALSNRIGDASILMSIAWMMEMGSWTFLNYIDFFYSNKSMIWVAMFVILASFTKSAQIPFSSWLPAAMAAPTPVSSLVHSSTLVTAGVYLLFRFSDLFSENFMKFILYVSLLTMFMAGLGANFEFDLKKIIALSTLSQLGMMLVIFSLGEKMLAFFHLLIHALFKALLFMCAGFIIHNIMNCQDIRYMGSLISYLPVTCSCFNISNLALCGLPFLSGFYSKDLIAEILSMQFMNFMIYIMFFISVGLTVSYSMRLSYYVLLGDFNMLVLNFLKEEKNQMLKSMVIMVFLVIFKGSILIWLMFPTPYFIIMPFYMKIMTLMMIFSGIILGYEFSQMKFYYQNKSLKFYHHSMFFSNMWNMPMLSTLGVSPYFLVLGKTYLIKLDYGWMEYYGSKNMFFMMKFFSQVFQSFSYNHLKIFMGIFFFFFFFFMFFYF